jgi:hypothetical protein
LIDPFLKRQGNGTDEANYKGYTRELVLSDGTLAGEQTGSDNPDKKALLPLEQLQIFLSPTGSLTTVDSNLRTTNGLTAIYSLDAGGVGNYLELAYSLGPGSSPDDIVVFVPGNLFSSGSYISLYSESGTWSPADACVVGGCSSSDRFEEWWVSRSNRSNSSSDVGPSLQSPVPEPATLVLVGTGLALVGTALRKRKR